MKYCHLIRRVFDRVGKKHEYSEFDSCVCGCLKVIGIAISVIMFYVLFFITLTNSQLIANKIVYNGIYNSTGCSLISDKCDKGHGFGNDVLVTHYFFPIKNTDKALLCFGENKLFLFDMDCIGPGLVNFIILIPIIFILCVCWRFVHHFCYCFHEATEIYQEEMNLVEVKTI